MSMPEKSEELSLGLETQSLELKFQGAINTAIEEHCSKDWPSDQQDILNKGLLEKMLFADDLLSGQWKDIEINILLYDIGIELFRINKSRKYETDPFWDIKARLDSSRIKPGITPRNVFITATRIVETGKTPKETKQEEAEKVRKANSFLTGLPYPSKIAPRDRALFNKDSLYRLARRNPRS